MMKKKKLKKKKIKIFYMGKIPILKKFFFFFFHNIGKIETLKKNDIISITLFFN